MKFVLIFLVFFSSCHAGTLVPFDQEKEEVSYYRMLLIKFGIQKVIESVEVLEIPQEAKNNVLKNIELLEFYMGFRDYPNFVDDFPPNFVEDL